MQNLASVEQLQIHDQIEATKNRRQLIFPAVPTDYVRSRLNFAFAAPISKGGGILQARVVFVGLIEGDFFEIEYASYGKSTVFYNFFGRIIAEPTGTRLEIITAHKPKSWQIIMMLVMGLMMSGFMLGINGFSGWELVIGTLLAGPIFSAVLFALNLAGNEMHKAAATNSVCELLQRIVYQR